MILRMKVSALVFVALSLSSAPSAVAQATVAAANVPAKLSYPQVKKVDVVDDYHGTKVADPYRWLEDVDSPDTKAWVEAENQVTSAYLDTIPQRAKIKERMTQLWNFERFTAPRKEGGRYFYGRNNGLQNQNVLYTTKSIDNEGNVLLDPNTLSLDGTVAMSGNQVSHDGKYLAYGLAASGSDWQEWHVRDIDTGKDLSDVIKWVKFSSASWSGDNKGFFYSRYDEPTEATRMTGANYYQKLYYHLLGTPQSQDVLVYQTPEHKEWGFGAYVTDDGNYLIINVSQGTDRRNRVYYKDLSVKNAPVQKLLDDFDASYNFIDNDGPVFWFKTDLDAPRGKVIAIDTRKPLRSNWKVAIPEAPDALEDVSVIGNKFIVRYLKDAHAQVKLFALDGKPAGDIELPGIGSVGGFEGKRKDNETFYSFTSFTTPTTIYRYDMVSGKSTIFRQPKVAFNPSDYETKQVFYRSKDGTRVPMFITSKKGITLDGSNPTLLYGYGGFDIAITPSFSVADLIWMEMGGVYVVANLRGGSEYGEQWHEAGMKLNKQNVFDDFVAAAEWLINNKYTSRDKLAIHGRSNGGLLVGAAETQRPDLFGAAIPGVGVMDMLRFHKFTIGWGWTSDYGSSDDPQQFKALYAYSPLHNIKPGTAYPPTLITTADHDDRVVPGHSFKFAAAMQAAQAGDAPVLIRIDTKAGHGGGRPTAKTIAEFTDMWGFLAKTLGMKLPEQYN